MAVPDGRQTTLHNVMFGRCRRVGGPGAKSAVSDCILYNKTEKDGSNHRNACGYVRVLLFLCLYVCVCACAWRFDRSKHTRTKLSRAAVTMATDANDVTSHIMRLTMTFDLSLCTSLNPCPFYPPQPGRRQQVPVDPGERPHPPTPRLADDYDDRILNTE